MSLQENLCEMERVREAYWLRYPQTSPVKLRWRALTVGACLHVLPGESILELGAGSGIWTEHLATVFRGESPITAAVFNGDFAAQANEKKLPNVRFVRVQDIAKDLPQRQFDYVVGTAILCHNLYAQNLAAIHSLLKPGGQILFFEANYWNPQVFLKSTIRAVGRYAGNADCQVGMRKYRLLRAASHEGFTNIDIIPYDIVHPLTPRPLVRWIRDLAFLLEHTPVVRDVCGTLYIWAKKPEYEPLPKLRPQLATHDTLFGSTSVVIPCHNEEMNVRPLVNALLQMYGKYIQEIILVNDNSTDGTAEVIRAMSRIDPRVKLLDRKPPGGVGRALREGCAIATGRYILTMDCDFVQIAPELRGLFDAVASGHDGAIGSRFSHESVLINYPLGKVICNRGFHLLMNVLLWKRMRDISNNLKFMRADILKSIAIQENHFAANVETGLKPILAGYDIKEVPISWVNRTTEMGQSSFRVLRFAPRYALALLRIVWNARLRRLGAPRPAEVLKKAASR